MKKKLFTVIMSVWLMGIIFLHAGCKKSEDADPGSLFDIRWILESVRYSPQNIVPIADTFSILFRQDGSMDLEVDCNTCGGTFVLGENGGIAFTDHSLCTEVDCGQDSFDDEFHAALDSADSYGIDGSALRVFFNNGQGRLHFIAQ